MTSEAGRGGHIIVMVQLGGVGNVPFVLDTGASITVLDKSFESKLGKRISTASIARPGDRQESSIYPAPKLFLGGVPLMTASNVFTYDFKKPMGVLCVDCLKNYCLQLDFNAEKIRFLDSQSATNAAGTWGKSFPILFSPEGPQGNVVLPVLDRGGLFGTNEPVVIDTGCNIDGLVEQGATGGRAVILPECKWEGAAYTNLILAAVEHANVIGLGFLARHLVTLDFPNQTMYLKQTSVGSLAGDAFLEIAGRDIRPAVELLESLRGQGRLPGWSNDDVRPIFFEAHSTYLFQLSEIKGATYLTMHSRPAANLVTLDFQRSGDGTEVHYTFWRPVRKGLWHLRKAWRTDGTGRIVGKYSPH